MTDEQKNEIIEILNKPKSIESYKFIASQVGLDEEQVKLFLNKNYGIYLWDYRGVIPNCLERKIISMRENDRKNITEISKLTGYPNQTIKRFLEEKNIPTDFRKGGKK